MSDLREAEAAPQKPKYVLWEGPYEINFVEVPGLCTFRRSDGSLGIRFAEPESADCRPDHVVER